MRYNNKSLRQHHQTLFAPLAWLERLEDQLHRSDDRYPFRNSIPKALNNTLIGLRTALIALQQSLRVEQQQLTRLLKNAGKSSLIEPLQPNRQRLSTQTQQLLDLLTVIHSFANRDHAHAGDHGHPEEYWDDTAALTGVLNDHLIHYLYLAETRYLPMADVLLGRYEQLQSTGKQKQPVYVREPAINALAHH